MREYSKIPTDDLLELMGRDEASVGLNQIRELASRGEKTAAKLREIIADEYYWYEGAYSDYWIIPHALAALGMMRDESSLPLFLDMLPHAYFSNHQDGIDMLPLAMAQFGKMAVKPFIKFISDHRGAFHDNVDYSYCRYDVSTALTMIAREEDSVRERVLDFLCGLFSDPEEDDITFLSFSIVHPIVLDKSHGFYAVRKAYDRDAIDEGICGSYDELVESYDNPGPDFFYGLERDIGSYYDPEEVQNRIQRLREETEEDHYTVNPGQSVPAGYYYNEEENISVKIGRNDPCPCASGKKYKKCCGAGK